MRKHERMFVSIRIEEGFILVSHDRDLLDAYGSYPVLTYIMAEW